MKTITLPTRLDVTLKLPRIGGLVRRTPGGQPAAADLTAARWGRRDLGQRVEDGVMCLLALTGFGSVGWSLFALW